MAKKTQTPGARRGQKKETPRKRRISGGSTAQRKSRRRAQGRTGAEALDASPREFPVGGQAAKGRKTVSVQPAGYRKAGAGTLIMDGGELEGLLEELTPESKGAPGLMEQARGQVVRRPNVRLGPVGNLLTQILEYYPKKQEIYITSGMDGKHGRVSHHYGLSYKGSPTAAIDIGGGGVTPAGSRRMRDVAKWLYDNFASSLVELIHTTPYSDDDGFYVKNGRKYPGGGPYAGDTARDHRDHVHLASSRALAERILAGLRGREAERGEAENEALDSNPREPSGRIRAASSRSRPLIGTGRVRGRKTLPQKAAAAYRKAAARTSGPDLGELANLLEGFEKAGGVLAGTLLPGGDLQRGDQGTVVKQLQVALVKLGHMTQAQLNTGPGIFGPQTEAALKGFQAKHAVPATGYYGPLTRAAFVKLGAMVGEAPATGGVSLEQLRAIMPNLKDARARQCLPHLNRAMMEASITTPKRQAAFLAQLAHESAEFRYFEELASGEAYEGRIDLGNTHPGDGKRYKGRGPIQLTGRNNYRAAGKELGIDLEANPQRAADVDVGFRTAGWFWTNRKLNYYADRSNFREITRRINGGYSGLANREMFYRRALDVLS